MAKIQVPKKIRSEDFKSEERDLIDKIAFAYNDFVDGVYQTLSKGIDYDNLNRQVVDITVTMDSAARVTQTPKVKITANGRIRGVNVLRAVNANDINTFPTSAPFVSWSVNANLLTILAITGLQAGSQYRLTLEFIV